MNGYHEQFQQQAHGSHRSTDSYWPIIKDFPYNYEFDLFPMFTDLILHNVGAVI
jgi:hypothetical protein